MKINKKISATALTLLAFSIAGCATGSSVSIGKTRPAVQVESVKVYIEPPKKFEVIGIVESASKGGGSNQAKTNRAIERLKQEAAKIGANGVMLGGIGSESAGYVGGYNNGIIYGGVAKNKTVSGKAIYVIEE